MITVYIILGLVAVCAVLWLILSAQIKRAKKAEAEAGRLHDAFWQVARKAEALQTAQKQTTKITEEANAERLEVTAAPDTDLVNRANALFGGGVPNNKNSKPNGN